MLDFVIRERRNVEINPIEIGSNEWLLARIDMDGWPGALDSVSANEIHDPDIAELWMESESLFNQLEHLYQEIDSILNGA